MATLSQLQHFLDQQSKQVAKLLGMRWKHVPLSMNSQIPKNYAAWTDNGRIEIRPQYLQHASLVDARGMLYHELAHAYHMDKPYGTGAEQNRQEVYADAVRFALWGNRDGWHVSNESHKIAERRGWTTGGGGGGGGTVQSGGEVGFAGRSDGGSGQSSRAGHSGDRGGGNGGGGGGQPQGQSTGEVQGNPQHTSASNPYFGLMAQFISGGKLRNVLTEAEWDGMLEFAHASLQKYGKDIPGGQPLQLFARTFAVYKMTGDFKDAFAAGWDAGVWSKDDSGWQGYVYTDKVGAVGSGSAGEPPPKSGIGEPPKAPGGTKADAQAAKTARLNNAASMEMWLQKAGIPVTDKIQGIIDEASKKGWNLARFQLAVEETNPGEAYLKQLQAYKESAFVSVISSLQMDDSKNLQALISKAAKENWSTDQFTQALYDTPEFHKDFPGIFEKDGSLKMQPSAYLQAQLDFQAQADQAGLNMGDNRMAWLFRNDVSPQEFADRSKAVQTLRDNQQYFQAFNQQLKAMGEKPLSKGDQFKFVMGEGSAQWYKLWQDASTRYAGTQAGIGFGQQGQAYTNIGKHQVEKIAGKGFDLSTMQQGFSDLAGKLQTVLPESQLESAGISKRDLVELEFGGPRSASIQKKVDQLAANLKSYQDYQPLTQGANPKLGSTQGSEQQKYSQGP